jgi:ribonuclease R
LSLLADIAALLASAEDGLSENEISSALRLPKHLKKRVSRALAELQEQGRIVKNSRHRYSAVSRRASSSSQASSSAGQGKKGPMSAVFTLTSGGTAFAKLEDGSNEFIVPERHRGWALPGDTVELRKLPPRLGSRDRGPREAAAVSRVLKRGKPELVGTLTRQGRETLLTLHQGDLELDIALLGVPQGIPDEDWIVATSPGLDEDGKEPVPARFLSHLGGEDTAHLDTLILIKKAGLKEEYSPAAAAEAAKLPEAPPEADFAGRLDLRGHVVFTIDGADAKDFDDAVSIERVGEGWKLGVHIADVSHYVKPGTALDREAYERSTSVYLPDRVLPMLPEALSNGLCSLKPNVPRLCLSAIMSFDKNGRMTGSEFAQSLIHSSRRFTYDEVEAWLEKREALSDAERPLLGPVLDEMKLLALKRRELREQRGGLDFNFPETKVDLDAKGLPLRLWRRTRLFSHQLIEEFMLAANEAVASELKRRGAPALYRIHERPDEDRLAQTMAILGRLKLGAPKAGAVEPKDLQKILKRMEGKKEERLVNTLLLRSLKLARYDANPDIHFGLALEDYCHFTSPIRRYPDLVVHRSLRAAVIEKRDLGSVKSLVGDVHSMGMQCSELERKAESCERDCVKAKQVRYLQTKIGERFEATVTSVTAFGFFAEIKDFPAEGLVPLALLEDDYYVFDQEWMRLEGRNTKRRFQIGDSVKIEVKRADWKSLQVDFVVRS